jgi:hypothetical protein
MNYFFLKVCIAITKDVVLKYAPIVIFITIITIGFFVLSRYSKCDCKEKDTKIELIK